MKHGKTNEKEKKISLLLKKSPVNENLMNIFFRPKFNNDYVDPHFYKPKKKKKRPGL